MQIARRLALIYVVALINIFSTLLPVWPLRFHLLTRGMPISLLLWAQHVTLFVGIGMLLVAYPAAHMHRRAAQWLLVCAAIAMVGNVMKGLDVEEAVANGVLVVVLWRSRGALRDIPLRYSVVDLGRLAFALVTFALLYRLAGGVVFGLLHQVAHGRPLAHTAGEWVERALTAKLRLQGLWFEESSLLLPVFLIGLFLVVSWTSLVRAFDSREGQADPYATFGRASHNSLAYLARRDGVATFYDADGRGAISYRLVGRVALQIGAILAPPDQRQAVYRAFIAWCRDGRLIPAAAALAEDELPAARACGMHALTIGREAVVDLTDFSVEKLAKKMRWAHRSLTKRGLRCALVAAPDVGPSLHVALDQIDAEWRAARGGESHGYCMTLGRFPRRDDRDCLVALVTDDHERALAYATFLPGGDGYYSLDLTRRSHDAPNATMEFLLMEALHQLRDRGATQVSLNFSALSSLEHGRIGRVARQLLGRSFQLGSLEAFNAKFEPRWVPRYAIVPSWAALPDVAFAMLALEGVDRMAVNACRRALRRWLGRLAVAGWAAPKQEHGVVA